MAFDRLQAWDRVKSKECVGFCKSRGFPEQISDCQQLKNPAVLDSLHFAEGDN